MKKIGLALGSGGWRGLSHIGVIKCLVENGYEISAIAGASAGSLVGGAYAALNDIAKIEQFFLKLSLKDLFLAFSDPGLNSGVFKSHTTSKIFEKFFGKHNIETLPIDFCAVATDLLTTRPVLLKTGDLAEAIRASSSLPVIFKPVNLNHHLLVDGGTSLPVPVTVARNMGVDIVIAVNVYASSFPLGKENVNNLNIFTITQQLILNNLSLPELNLADIVINPKLANSITNSLKNFIGNQAAIDAGYTAMEAELKSLKTLTNSLPNP